MDQRLASTGKALQSYADRLPKSRIARNKDSRDEQTGNGQVVW